MVVKTKAVIIAWFCALEITLRQTMSVLGSEKRSDGFSVMIKCLKLWNRVAFKKLIRIATKLRLLRKTRRWLIDKSDAGFEQKARPDRRAFQKRSNSISNGIAWRNMCYNWVGFSFSSFRFQSRRFVSISVCAICLNFGVGSSLRSIGHVLFPLARQPNVRQCVSEW